MEVQPSPHAGKNCDCHRLEHKISCRLRFCFVSLIQADIQIYLLSATVVMIL